MNAVCGDAVEVSAVGGEGDEPFGVAAGVRVGHVVGLCAVVDDEDGLALLS